MFFNAHVYYSKRVDKNLDALKVAGCLLPDMASTGLITWDDLHRKKGILNFFEYVNKSASQFSSLLKGINYHNTLDYSSHLEYKNSTPGYSYVNVTPELFNLVKNALNTDDATTKSMTHNFIESGVDYHLLHEHPELAGLIKDSLKEIDMQGLVKVLSVFYQRSETEVLTGLRYFFSFVTHYDLRDIDEWTALFAELGKSFLKTEVNEEYIKKALELSFKLTQNSYGEYLETSIASWNNEIKDST